MTKEELHADEKPGRRDLILKIMGAATFAGFASMGKGVSLAAATPILTPEETEGPYWVDEQLNRSDIIYDPTDDTFQPGFPLLLLIHVNQVANGVISALPNAYIDIWQCNASGLYSDEAVENTLGQKYLRGYQVTNASGNVHFTTIYPGWYTGRTPHIHCRVRMYSGTTTTYNFTTQFFFDQAITDAVYLTAPYNARGAQNTYNSDDMVYTQTDCMTAAEDGAETMLTLVKDATYAVARVSMLIDLALPKNKTC
jgi:protocatechuate 3,4-dioxygenase beta subunit